MWHIVVDAMGGDNAPSEPIAAAAAATLVVPDTQITLVGDARQIGDILPKHRHDGSRIRVHHAPDIISNNENPFDAVHSRPNASIVQAMEIAKPADVVISAGNTSAASYIAKKIWPVVRPNLVPAQCSVFPTELRRGHKSDPFCLVLDVGASYQVTTQTLIQFAHMGASYARRISQNDRPRVGLLFAKQSVPPTSPLALAHRALLETTQLNFTGFVPVESIPRGVADVIICSGEVGHNIHRSLNHMPQMLLRLGKYAYKDRLLWRGMLTMLSKSFERIKGLTDWKQYGGAPLLGFDRLFLSVHSGATKPTLVNAIRLARKASRAQVLGHIETDLQLGANYQDAFSPDHSDKQHPRKKEG